LTFGKRTAVGIVDKACTILRSSLPHVVVVGQLIRMTIDFFEAVVLFINDDDDDDDDDDY